MKENDGSYYRTILDAIPLAIFVVDEDVRIHDLNTAAATVFGLNKATVFKRRGGEVLHCLHRHDVPEGCGRGEFCQTCVIRNSVEACLKGQTVTRRRTKVELLLGESKKELELLITASPLPSNNEPLALLIIEDISEMTTLQDIIPICAKCKKIRDDQKYWHSVEAYFKDYIGVDFSHGLCPKCMKELYPYLSN
ncbi:MAG: PAS domain S-box protein [Thermodesulfobacteriota bacterium]